MKTDNLILEKSFAFAVRIVNLCKVLKEQKVIVLSRQLLKSGTSIGANIREAQRAQTRNDFIAKMNIALKEAYETEYWLELLYATELIDKESFDITFRDCRSITNIVCKIVLTSKNNLNFEF